MNKGTIFLCDFVYLWYVYLWYVCISVQPKPGFGIGNRNQDQGSVSVSGPEFFCLNLNFPHFNYLPKNHFSYDLKDKEQYLDSQDDTDI